MRIKNTLSTVLLGTTLVFLVPACAQAPKKDPKFVEFEKALEDHEKLLQEAMEKYNMEEYTMEEYLKEMQASKEGKDSVSQQESVNPLVQEYASKLEGITNNSYFSSSYGENAFCGVDLKKVEHGYNLNVYTHHDSWDVTYELDNNLMLHAVVNYRSNEEPARFEVTPSDGASYQAHQDRANVFLKEVLESKTRPERYVNPLLTEHSVEDFLYDNYLTSEKVIESLENGTWHGRCPEVYVVFRKLTSKETALGNGYILEHKNLDDKFKNVYLLDENLAVRRVISVMGSGNVVPEVQTFTGLSNNPNDLMKFQRAQEEVNEFLDSILYWKAEHQKQD